MAGCAPALHSSAPKLAATSASGGSGRAGHDRPGCWIREARWGSQDILVRLPLQRAALVHARIASRWRSRVKQTHGAAGYLRHPSPTVLKSLDMATQQFDGGVPFAIASSAQKLQLLELPADVAALLDAPNPPRCAPSSRPASWIAF